MGPHALPGQSKQLFDYLFNQASLGMELSGKILLANPALYPTLDYRDNELSRMDCSQLSHPEDSQEDVVDPKTLRFLDPNERTCHDLGYTREELLTRRVTDIDPTFDDEPLFAKRLEEIDKSGFMFFETTHKRKGGSTYAVEISLKRVELDPVYFIAIIRNITERKRPEKALRESEHRLRLAVRAGRMYAFVWDRVTDVIVRSGEFKHIFNWTSGPHHDSEREFYTRVHPDDREVYSAVENRLTPGNPTYQVSFRVMRPDGDVIWLNETGRASFDEQGKLLQIIGIVADITERKRAEEITRESEDKLRLVLDSTAQAIYGIDLEQRCTFCNPSCLRILGYRHADELLGKNMHNLIHHTRADGTVYSSAECRIHRTKGAGEAAHADSELLWRKDGTGFPVECWSYPQRKGHEVVGAVVTFIDITERKLAEAALTRVSSRLIEAQEQERTRIGRELHDDICQRLALLAVELQQLKEDSRVLPKVRSRMAKLGKQVSEIAADIQSLSHELHSARLQYLGIAAAMRGFCREFRRQQKMEIEFKTHDLPTPLSADVSLCLFRVLQEALHNSARHSGARQVEVRLWGTSDAIHLTIRDFGTGFDREAAKTSRGLGLISMEERLKLVNGTISIDSNPKRGTTIEASVPLRSITALRSVG